MRPSRSRIESPPRSNPTFDNAADGQKFLFADTLEEQAAANPIVVVLNALK